MYYSIYVFSRYSDGEMLKIVLRTVRHQKSLAIFKYNFTKWKRTSRLTGHHKPMSRNRKMYDVLRNDKWFGEPILMGLTERYNQF